MTPNEYLILQESNKKIYELARNEEERRQFLAKMMEAETRFMRENIPSVEVDETVLDQPLSLSMSPKSKALDAQDSKVLFVTIEKVTPANFFEKVSAKERDTGKPVDLRELLKSRPEIIQNLCDHFNAINKANLQKDFGNQKDLDMFEDDQDIGFKQNPERIKNPDAEVHDIMVRAQNHAASKHQSLESSSSDTPVLEEELNHISRGVK